MEVRVAVSLLALAALTGASASSTPQGRMPAPKPSFGEMPFEISALIMSYNSLDSASNEDSFISLCEAALSDNAIKLIIDGSLNIRAQGEAMLGAACRAGLYSVAELLMKQGAAVTPLVAVNAAAGGNVALLKMLDPECTRFREHLGEMLLHADYRDHFHMVKYLLDNGAPALACRMKVLMTAAEKGHMRQVEYLIEHGANSNLLLGKALASAVRGERIDLVDHLLHRGAHVNADNGAPLSEAAKRGDMAMVQLLKARGADLHTNEDWALRSAASSGNVILVTFLLDVGAHVNAWNGAPLSEAASNGDIAMVQLLESRGADLRMCEDRALRSAARSGSIALVAYLLERGANVNAKTVLGETPLLAAAKNGDMGMVQFLEARNADLHICDDGAIGNAAGSGNVALVAYLLDRGTHVNAWNGKPLRIARERRDNAMINLLVSRGAW